MQVLLPARRDVMKSSVRKWLFRFGLGILIIYAALSLVGAGLLSRDATPSVSDADISKLAARPLNVRWQETCAVMEKASPKGTPLTWPELECARKLVGVALTAVPDEWEGRDLARASSGTVQYLRLLYPELNRHVIHGRGNEPYDLLRLGVVQQHISSQGPHYWLVPLIEASRWLNPDH